MGTQGLPTPPAHVERIKKTMHASLFLLGNRNLAPGIEIVTLDLGSELSILMVLENQLRWA